MAVPKVLQTIENAPHVKRDKRFSMPGIPIKMTPPSGKLTFHIFAALAEFERDILRQRVNAGLKAARRRGRVGGRPKALDEADLKRARALLRSG